MRLRALAMTPVLLAVTFGAGLTRPAAAQDLSFLTNLFKEINSVAIYGIYAHPFYTPELVREKGVCLVKGLCGAGAEILLNLVEGERYQAELGLSASYERNITGRARADSMVFTGTVRSFPTATLYVSFPLPRPESPALIYGGASFGLVDLWNARTLDSVGRQRSVEASTFGYGMRLGVAWEVPFGALYIEGGYRGRVFPSLHYSDDTINVPRNWPRRFDFSGVELQFGVQFDLKASADTQWLKLPGSWRLRLLDGDTVPTLVEQSAEFVRTEMREMLLRLSVEKKKDSAGKETQDSTFQRVTYTRAVRVNADGHQLSVTPKEDTVSGTWSFAKDSTLTLTPKDTTKPKQTLKPLGNRLVSNALMPNHRLVFVRSRGK